MRTLGILGGMSWESTLLYYRLLNEGVRDALGGLHSADLLLRSFDFARIEALQAAGDWERAGEVLASAAAELERAGARALVVATNTMHKLAPAIEERVAIPLLHIADATADALVARGHRRPLLLATRYTMEQTFYRGRLAERGIEAIVPDERGRTIVHDAIYEELCRGIVSDDSRAAYVRIVRQAADGGADAVIFGCTEVGLLLSSDDVPLPVFDTTALHCEAAVRYMLSARESVSSESACGAAHER